MKVLALMLTPTAVVAMTLWPHIIGIVVGGIVLLLVFAWIVARFVVLFMEGL